MGFKMERAYQFIEKIMRVWRILLGFVIMFKYSEKKYKLLYAIYLPNYVTVDPTENMEEYYQ